MCGYVQIYNTIRATKCHCFLVAETSTWEQIYDTYADLKLKRCADRVFKTLLNRQCTNVQCTYKASVPDR